jgi:hypothetical protein
MYEADRRGAIQFTPEPDEAGRGPDVDVPRWVGWVGVFLTLGGLIWLPIYFWAKVDYFHDPNPGRCALPLNWFWLRRVAVQWLAMVVALVTVLGSPFALYLACHIPAEIYKHSYRIAARKAGATGPPVAGRARPQDLRALDELRKEDPEAAERIMEEIDSGRASIADLGDLVFRTRQDALSVEKVEARLRADERLRPREPSSSDEP